MARYDFVCERCGCDFEQMHPMSNPPQYVECIKCSGSAYRQLSMPGVINMGADGSKRSLGGAKFYRDGKRSWD